MNNKPKQKIKTFMLPVEDNKVNELLARDGSDIVVTNKQTFFAPKEGLLYYLVEYTEYDNEENYSYGDE